MNREISKQDNNNYAKIYLRADLKKTEIRRTYQKITEFYADASSILVGIYEFLIIIISIINNFYSENSIIKKLFIFKGIKDKHFNIQNRYQKIKELLALNEKNLTLSFIKENNNIENEQISAKLNIDDLSIESSSSNRSQESKLFLSNKRINNIVKNHRNSITRDLAQKKIKKTMKRR